MTDLAIALKKIEHEQSAELDEAFNAWYPELKKSHIRDCIAAASAAACRQHRWCMTAT